MKFLPVLAACIIVFITGCQKDAGPNTAPNPVVLHFSNVVGNQPLVLNTKFTNTFGEEFTLTKYKYYISNIALVDADGKETTAPESYFLIDQANTVSKALEVQLPGGLYKGLSFIVGVDSTRNVSGAQSGALDPANDMFWTWNTGYIMAKMEGTSPASAVVNNKVEYHIGGFKGTQNAVRKVTILFDQTQLIPDGKSAHIYLNADVLKWFNGAHSMTIAATPAIMTPGTQAMQFADNYSKMFTLSSISVQ